MNVDLKPSVRATTLAETFDCNLDVAWRMSWNWHGKENEVQILQPFVLSEQTLISWFCLSFVFIRWFVLESRTNHVDPDFKPPLFSDDFLPIVPYSNILPLKEGQIRGKVSDAGGSTREKEVLRFMIKIKVFKWKPSLTANLALIHKSHLVETSHTRINCPR